MPPRPTMESTSKLPSVFGILMAMKVAGIITDNPVRHMRACVAQQRRGCYNAIMKTYIHARLSKQDRTILEDLKKSTGVSESELVRRGLQLVLRDITPKKTALELAGRSVGKFKKGPRDLATNRKHLEGFGE
jgi:hypothetical protein